MFMLGGESVHNTKMLKWGHDLGAILRDHK